MPLHHQPQATLFASSWPTSFCFAAAGRETEQHMGATDGITTTSAIASERQCSEEWPRSRRGSIPPLRDKSCQSLNASCFNFRSGFLVVWAFLQDQTTYVRTLDGERQKGREEIGSERGRESKMRKESEKQSEQESRRLQVFTLFHLWD